MSRDELYRRKIVRWDSANEKEFHVFEKAQVVIAEFSLKGSIVEQHTSGRGKLQHTQKEQPLSKHLTVLLVRNR